MNISALKRHVLPNMPYYITKCLVMPLIAVLMSWIALNCHTMPC